MMKLSFLFQWGIQLQTDGKPGIKLSSLTPKHPDKISIISTEFLGVRQLNLYNCPFTYQQDDKQLSEFDKVFVSIIMKTLL